MTEDRDVYPSESDRRWALRLDHWPGVTGGFSQRGSITAADPLSGLNMGHVPGADSAVVEARRARMLADMGLAQAPIVHAEQVHGNQPAIAQTADLGSLPRRNGYPYYPGADALVTSEPGLVLMLFYADCVPVWLWCPRSRTIAVAHCGWRGTVADMAGATVEAMVQHFGAEPTSMHACIGPSICGACYEVGEEVVEQVRQTGHAERVVRNKPDGKFLLNLQELNRLMLTAAGVAPEHIEVTAPCTRCGPVPMYSWRRDGQGTGRMVALMALRLAQ